MCLEARERGKILERGELRCFCIRKQRLSLSQCQNSAQQELKSTPRILPLQGDQEHAAVDGW